MGNDWREWPPPSAIPPNPRVFRVWRLIEIRVEDIPSGASFWHASAPEVTVRLPFVSDVWRWCFWRCDWCGERFRWREPFHNCGWGGARFHLGECASLWDASERLGSRSLPSSIQPSRLRKFWLAFWLGRFEGDLYDPEFKARVDLMLVLEREDTAQSRGSIGP